MQWVNASRIYFHNEGIRLLKWVRMKSLLWKILTAKIIENKELIKLYLQLLIRSNWL